MCSVASCFCSVALPSDAEYMIELWDSAKGLPQNTVNGLVQTDDGYLWCATQEGLVRFDGVGFAVFDRLNVPGLKVGYFTCLSKSRSGNLVAGTFREGVYVLGSDGLRPIRYNDVLKDAVVNSVLQTSDGAVWAGTERGLFRFSEEGVRRYGTGDGLPDANVLALAQGSDGAVWVGTAERGIARARDGGLGRFEVLATEYRGVSCFAPARDGGMWAGAGRDLYRVSGEKAAERRMETESDDNAVRAVHEDPDGTLWVGVQNGGVWRVSGEEVRRFTTEDGLSSNFTLSMLRDAEGNCWVGTSGAGLNQIRPRKVQSISKGEGLSHQAIWTVMQSRDGSLWTGTIGGGVCRLAPDGKTTAYGLGDGLTSMITTALCETKDGSIWVGTGGAGLLRFDGGRFALFPLGSSNLERTIWSVFEDADASLWVGTAQGLFHVFPGGIRKYTMADGLPGDSVRCVAKSPGGALWAATDSGPAVLGANGRFLSWRDKEGLTADGVFCMKFDPDGTLWMGTRNAGILHFDGKRSTAITVKQGLFDDYAFAIVEDGSGNFWASCNRGIFRTPKQDLLDFVSGKRADVRSEPFGVEEGMRNRECNGGRHPAGLRTGDGRVVFSTMDGLAVIDPRSLSSRSFPPKIVMESVAINRQPVSLFSQPVIPPSKGDLEFKFTAPSFLTPKKTSFYYRLDPYDADWIDAAGMRAAYYTNIPPGAYTFRAKARNADGVWSRAEARYAFTLSPAFHQTWVFDALVAAGIALLTACFAGMNLRRLRRQKRGLEKLVHERTLQLEKALRTMEEMANTDGLTNVANRRCFEDCMAREWRRSLRDGLEISVLLVDVDYFKAYNDTYGHIAGDDCLKRLAEILRSSVKRASDMVGRYGGEEFILVLPGTPLEGAMNISERIMENLREADIPHRDSKVSEHLTVSIGAACAAPSRETTPESLVLAADKALYHAKSAGRNRAEAG